MTINHRRIGLARLSVAGSRLELDVAVFAPDPATARSSATTDASKATAFVESRLHVGGRLEWFCGFDEIELDSPRASLGHIRTERRNRRRL